MGVRTDIVFQIPNVPDWRLGENKWLSKKDIQKLRKMYNCGKNVLPDYY